MRPGRGISPMGALLIYHEVKRFSSPPDYVQTISDLVAVGSRHRFAAPSLADDVRQRKTRQMLTHMVSDVGPHPEQNALALVIAGPVLVGFAKVARVNRAIHGGHDLGQGDRLGGPGQT